MRGEFVADGADGREVRPQRIELPRAVDGPGLVAALAARGVKIRDRGGVVADAVRISIGTPEDNDALLAGLAAFAGPSERLG